MKQEQVSSITFTLWPIPDWLMESTKYVFHQVLKLQNSRFLDENISLYCFLRLIPDRSLILSAKNDLELGHRLYKEVYPGDGFFYRK